VSLGVGQELSVQEYQVTRADLIWYAGASLDFNPIHWSDRVARSVGLPGVIAHGMYTLALASRAVVEWAGGTDRVLEFGGRFTKPVEVPDDDFGTTIRVAGKVADVSDGVARIYITVTCNDTKVLGMTKASVRC
jgi:acyl dehydratase